MKNFILISLALILLITFSCKKNDDEKAKTPFEFNGLVASSTTPLINDVITVDATAKGDGLTYSWSEHEEGGTIPYGTLTVVSDGHIQWTVCHSAVFVITCKVEDMYGNSKEDSLYIHVQK
jgi:hypothetical protein